MDYFPVCLDIKDRPCLVVGGGRVAVRKVEGLLACGGEVTVISPELVEGLATLVSSGQVRHLARGYRHGDLAAAFLVIAATDDEDVQAEVYQEAEEHNILLNVADVPKWCNFILPATVRRGSLAVSISTGGKSPALARKIRQDLEKDFGAEYDLLLQMLGSLRSYVLGQGRKHEENKVVFEQLLHPEMIAWVREQNWQQVEEHLNSVLGPDFDLAAVGFSPDQGSSGS